MDWPDDDVSSANKALQPSKLSGNIKKRKAPSQLKGGIKKTAVKTPKNDSDDDYFNNNDDDEYDEQDDYAEDAQHVNKKQKVVEVSSTQRVSAFKAINDLTRKVAPQKIKALDPRFMDYAGEYDRKHVDKNYEFLEEMRNQEVDEMKKRLKKIKGETAEKDVLKRKLQSVETKMRTATQRKEKDVMLEQFRQQQKTLAKEGVVPQLNQRRVEKEIGAAKEFLSLSGNQMEKRIKHKRERKINKERNLMRHTKQWRNFLLNTPCSCWNWWWISFFYSLAFNFSTTYITFYIDDTCSVFIPQQLIWVCFPSCENV